MFSWLKSGFLNQNPAIIHKYPYYVFFIGFATLTIPNLDPVRKLYDNYNFNLPSIYKHICPLMACFIQFYAGVMTTKQIQIFHT